VGVGVSIKENNFFLPNLNFLVAVSKGMWAVKLCSKKILLWLTEGVG